MHIHRSGTLEIPIPPRQALALFTAEGERDWVPGWDPHYLHVDRSSQEEGTVFRTSHDGEETIWLVVRWEPGDGVARYARLTPERRVGTVEVRCDPRPSGGSRVTVTYSLTALNAEEAKELATLTPEAYQAMLVEWQERIMDLLEGSGTDGPGPAD
jgi:hypothetical protein